MIESAATSPIEPDTNGRLETGAIESGVIERVDSPAVFGDTTPAAVSARRPREPMAAPIQPGLFGVPKEVTWKKFRWGIALSIGVVHLLAFAAAIPWLFSWSGLALSFVGVYIFGTLGINICFHRLLTHRSFKTPVWLERCFAVLGVCCLEGSPAAWVAHHRMHHQHSDHEQDPHSPLVAFFWSHIGWMLVENRAVNTASTCERYAKDICKDWFYRALTRHQRWLLIYLGHAALFFLGGFAVGGLIGDDLTTALQLGLSWLVWGVLVRTILVWHITWSVNSLTHMAGYRNYETDENSRNNWFVALISNGEGWHNNHHADQRSAAHGHRWFEFDVSYLTIQTLRVFGLASDIIKPARDRGEFGGKKRVKPR